MTLNRLEIGDHIGPYQVDSRLGAGGMGQVYRCRDLRLGRQVAIKTLGAETVDASDMRQRFLREAQLLAAVQHQNVVALHNIEQDPVHGTVLVMECVEGEDLAARLAGGPWQGKKLRIS